MGKAFESCGADDISRLDGFAGGGEEVKEPANAEVELGRRRARLVKAANVSALAASR
jgi:hypothetical protein